MLTFSLTAIAPFRLDLTAWAIRRRPANAIDAWDGEKYERVIAINGRPALVSVKQAGAAKLEVAVSGARAGAPAKRAVTVALERLLGFGIDLEPFYRFASEHPRLDALARRFRGLKPPRFPTVWEALVNGIACQQLSLTVGILLLNRLAALCGLPFEERHAFPRPEDLAAADPEAVRSLGFSGAKVRALIGLGREIVEGRVDPESWEALGDEEALSRLMDLRGVGRWTAEYTLLRGMGRIGVFPGDDVGGRKSLARWMHLRKALDYRRVARVAGKWKPYGGLIYFHFLLDGLERAGYLAPAETRIRKAMG